MLFPSSTTHQPRCFCRQMHGFTLTELLVALSVIFLLAVVLVSLTSSIMAHTRKTGCVSNIRTQLVGMLAYTSDHGKNYYWAAG